MAKSIVYQKMENGQHFIIDLKKNQTHSPQEKNIRFDQLLIRNSYNPFDNTTKYAFFALRESQVCTWGINDENNILLDPDTKVDCTKIKATETTLHGIKKLLLVMTTNFGSPKACILGLTHQNTVISWGSGSKGCLGRKDWKDNKAPTEITFPKEGASIEKIYASNGSIFAIDGDGTLFAWGANDRGELGIYPLGEHFDPPIVPPFFRDKAVDEMILSDFSYLILAKDRSGNYYMWGSYFNMPVTIEKLNFEPESKISSIIRSHENFFAIDQNGAVYTWGNVKKNALLGRSPNNAETVFEKQPSKVIFNNAPLLAEKIFVSEHFSYNNPHIVFVLGKDNKVYAWGKKLIENDNPALTPIQIPFSDNANPTITFIDTMMLIAYVTPVEAYQLNLETLQFDPISNMTPLNCKSTGPINGTPSSSGKFQLNSTANVSTNDGIASSQKNDSTPF